MSDADKIADLESRLAQQEHTLDELSGVVAEQARVIDLFREQLRRLTDRMGHVEDTVPGKGPDEPPPPHY
ncbi:MAG: SlyX family protein [Rhodospirillaceae bacterium]|jgi:SlyX protein|nr:SlyX family protein [Rhodospirillaceae bacterium]MBT5943249.1 SlyX family protein [Rhodospirillaceae bacterium]MBT6405434.1 SlyX family protein [Rhodospirillaceae bacterium]MBT6535352.1 SlyX family protein [Rhodospirillaceae bacterium]MBT7362230.1 SlyX family protein [Rhodospirillaceae bacterium]